MAVAYDPKVVQAFADRLYRSAKTMVVSYMLVGAFVVGVVVAVLTHGPISVTAVSTVLGAAIGYAMGNSRALALRMQAQAALCQLQIEQNTRRAA